MYILIWWSQQYPFLGEDMFFAQRCRILWNHPNDHHGLTSEQPVSGPLALKSENWVKVFEHLSGPQFTYNMYISQLHMGEIIFKVGHVSLCHLHFKRICTLLFCASFFIHLVYVCTVISNAKLYWVFNDSRCGVGNTFPNSTQQPTTNIKTTPCRLENGPSKKYRRFYTMKVDKYIGVYKNFSGKYRVNIGKSHTSSYKYLQNSSKFWKGETQYL